MNSILSVQVTPTLPVPLTMVGVLTLVTTDLTMEVSYVLVNMVINLALTVSLVKVSPLTVELFLYY